MAAPLITLNNGQKMPAFGLGTMHFNGDDGIRAVRAALDAGYRHIDSAYVYANEADVGRAVREKIAAGAVQRSDVFVTTKLWNTFHAPALVEHACRLSLAALQLDYIDLYLMHFPVGFVHSGDDAQLWPKESDPAGAGRQRQACTDVDFVDTWRAMERLVDLGLVRSIGVSNFNSQQIARVLEVARIRPVANQIECSPALAQRKLTTFCKAHEIAVIGYSPLGGRPDAASRTPAYLFDERVEAIGRRHGKTAAQVVLRYLHELGVVAIPKSVTPERIAQNVAVFDFALTAADRAVLESFEAGTRMVALSDARHSKHWPFGVEF